MESVYDLLVIGGGINGAGIARDAAGRGLKVALVEQDDLAAHTSSASSKLIHGGIRYLEQYEFRLVRKALKEREVLLRIAPHIVWPMRFALPHEPHLRPAWMIRIGLALYDYLDLNRSLPKSRSILLDKPPFAGLLSARYRKGFEYSDCWVDDARLVILNAVDAAQHGADILTHHRCISLETRDGIWSATLRHAGQDKTIDARAVANAAGPWVPAIGDMVPGGPYANGADPRVRLVKGSHIVVPRIVDSGHGLLFQNADGRVVFALPFEDDFTMIGTTDAPAPEDLAHPEISETEVDYLIAAANRYFAKDISRDDIVWTFAGVRSLFDDGSPDPSDVTRDYVLQHETASGGAPIVHVIGGKITTYRRLAEDVLDRLGIGSDKRTATAPLPGAAIDVAGPQVYAAHLFEAYPDLPSNMLARMARSYGSISEDILGKARKMPDLGKDFGHGLTEAELRYLVSNEFARSADDVLWRRTKLGLYLDEAQQQHVARWMAENPA